MSTNFIYISTAEEKIGVFDGFIVGRSFKSDYKLTDKMVSSSHFELKVKNGFLFIRDLGSHNGTFVNGEKIVPDKYLQLDKDDIIRVGKESIFVNAVPMSAGEITLPDITGQIQMAKEELESSFNELEKEQEAMSSEELLLVGQKKTRGLAGLRKIKKQIDDLIAKKEMLINARDNTDESKVEYNKTITELKNIDNFLLQKNIKGLSDIERRIEEISDENDAILNEMNIALKKIEELKIHVAGLKKCMSSNDKRENELKEYFSLCTQRDRLVLLAGDLDKKINSYNASDYDTKITELDSEILKWKQRLKSEQEEFGANFENSNKKKK